MSTQISLLIVVKDRLERLQECLESLKKLTDEAKSQLVIACDGSPQSIINHIEEALKDFHKSGWETKVLQLPHGGPAKARNAAFDHLNGEIILFLNDDIRVEKGLLSAHLKVHQLQPGYAVMGNTRWAPEIIHSEFQHWIAHHDSFYYLIQNQLSATWEYFHTMNLSLHRSWIEKGFRFDETFPEPAFEDTEFGYRLVKEGLKIGFAYDAILYHVHTFEPDQYWEKCEMRGRSARHFCELYPELKERITSEYTSVIWREESLSSKARAILFKKDPVEEWNYLAAKAFMRGYETGIPSPEQD